MAKLGINTGSSPNDGLGDSLLSGALKINSNFNEIYNAIGNGTSITNTISFANTAFSLSGKPNIDVGFATVSNLDVGIGGSALIVTNDGVISIGTDTTSADIEIFEKNISIDGSSIIAPDSYIFIQDAEIANLFTYNAEVSGVITASSYIGSGSKLTGIVTTILAGENISIAQTGGTLTITSSGSLQSRTTVIGVTTSIANNGIGNTNITGFKSYALMKVGLSTAGRLRLYTDNASRAADASRIQGVDPEPGSGLIAEVITTGISTTQIISPFVMGGNLNNPADTTIYAAITNLSGSTQAITANLTILQLEAPDAWFIFNLRLTILDI